MEGWLTIGTKIDDKQFERQLADLQRKADKKQVAIDVTSSNIENLELDLKVAKQEQDAYFKEYEKIVQAQGRWKELQAKGGYNLQGRELAEWQTGFFIDYDKQLEDLDKKMEEATVGNFEKLSAELEKQKEKLKDQQYEYDKIIQKIETINQKQEQQKLDDINSRIKNISGSITGVIKKIGKWGLALLGIRAMYGFIRNAVNQVAQEDQTMQQQIQYINYAIGTALKPVLEFILNIIYKIIAGIGAIIKLITGVNIFAKATANSFAKANSSAGDLRKTLAGFDEMNIIGGTGGTGLLGDIGADLGKLRDLSTEVEKVSSKIKDWFTKPLPTREELQENANTYKNAWIRVGEFLGLGTIFNDFKTRLTELKESLKLVWQPVIDSFNQMIAQIKAYLKPFTDYINEHFIKPIKEMFTNWKDEFLLKYAKFINKLIYIANLFLQFFGVQIEYIDEESAITGKDIQENIGGAMKKVKEDSDKTANSLGTLWQRLKDLTSKTWKFVVNLVAGGDINEKLSSLRQMLGKIGINVGDIKLAKGGIINMPSRGVPVGGAIAGERGMEGVIPLTDSQQMALLGEAIGKYININATVPVYVGNRMVARELKRIEAEDNFAYNR